MEEQVHDDLPKTEVMQNESEDDSPQDPGQLEGKPKTQHEPPPDSPRWKQVYKGWKENERKVSELETVLQERNKDIEALTKQHKELFEVVHAPKVEEPKRDTEAEEQERFKTMQEIADLKSKKKEALRDMDLVAAEDVGEQIRELEKKLEKPSVKTTETPEQSDMNKAVQTFTNETEWFNPNSEKVNERMRAYAIYLEGTMLPKWQGSYPSLLKEIKEKVEKDFEYGKPAEVTTGRQQVLPMVEGVSGGGQSSEAKMTLTDEQRRVARMMFPDNPDAETIYHKELTKLNKGRK